MRMISFAKRNFKEIVRDPLNLSFLFGFPVLLLVSFAARGETAVWVALLLVAVYLIALLLFIIKAGKKKK